MISFFSPHSLPHQEALYAKSLETNYVMETVIKAVNFSHCILLEI